MRVNVYIRNKKTKNGEKHYYLVIRRYGRKDESMALGPISKRQAKQKQATLLTELLTGEYQHQSVLSLPLSEFTAKFLDEFASGARSTKTVKLYRDLLKGFLSAFKSYKLHEITREHIEVYLSKLALSGRTKNMVLSTLNVMFQKAVEWGYLKASPSHGVKRFKEIKGGTRSLSPEELGRLFELATPWQKSLLKVAIHTGMRRGELLNFRFSDIDWSANCIRIFGKGSKLRHLQMSADLSKELRFLQDNWPNPQYGADRAHGMQPFLKRTAIQKEFVFCQESGTPFKDCSQSLAKLYKKANMKGIGVHGLRKTFCSLLARGGTHVKVAQQLMGHTDPRLTLEIYTEVQPDQHREAVSNLPSFASFEKPKSRPEMQAA